MSKVNNDPNPKKAVRMPFGQHKGEFLSEVPLDYLNWFVDREIPADLREEISEEITRRSNRPGAGKVVRLPQVVDNRRERTRSDWGKR